MAALMSPQADPTPPSLLLEELTWPEVRDALAAGYRNVLVPCGAVEQHGPHVAMVSDTLQAGAIARRVAEHLGEALVAPTISVGCSDHHLAFPGTSLCGGTRSRRCMRTIAGAWRDTDSCASPAFRVTAATSRRWSLCCPGSGSPPHPLRSPPTRTRSRCCCTPWRLTTQPVRDGPALGLSFGRTPAAPTHAAQRQSIRPPEASVPALQLPRITRWPILASRPHPPVVLRHPVLVPQASRASEYQRNCSVRVGPVAGSAALASRRREGGAMGSS
jgi:hypothetical protein